LPPGLLRLATSRVSTGSPPIVKTIGMVVVQHRRLLTPLALGPLHLSNPTSVLHVGTFALVP